MRVWGWATQLLIVGRGFVFWVSREQANNFAREDPSTIANKERGPGESNLLATRNKAGPRRARECGTGRRSSSLLAKVVGFGCVSGNSISLQSWKRGT